MSLQLTLLYHQLLTTCPINNYAILFENYCGSNFIVPGLNKVGETIIL